MNFHVVGTNRNRALSRGLALSLLAVVAAAGATTAGAHAEQGAPAGIQVAKKGGDTKEASQDSAQASAQASEASGDAAASDARVKVKKNGPKESEPPSKPNPNGKADKADAGKQPENQQAEASAPQRSTVQPNKSNAEPEAKQALPSAPPPRSGQAPPPPPPVPTPTVRPRPQSVVTPKQTVSPKPPEPVDRNEFRPMNGEQASEPLDFNYEGADLINVIKSVGAMTGKNFFIDPAVGQQKITVISYAPMPPELAYYVLESILAAAGFKMVEDVDGNLIKIRPINEDTEKAQIHTGFLPPEGYDEFSTFIVPVQYADVTELSTILRQLGSKSARVDAYGPTNTLILHDTADGIRNMVHLLEQIDVPDYETMMEIFILEYTRAEILSQQIQEVLLGTEGQAPTSGRPSPAARPTPTRPIRPTVPGQQASTVIGAREETLRIVSDERLNALVVIATEPLMERVRDLINKLDTPTPYEANNMHIYELLHANAEMVESALNAVTSTAPRQGGQQGAAQTGEIQPFERKVIISKYEQTNALLIVASPQDYKIIRELIAQLDVPQRQVHVEAVIMEVAITDGFQLSVESTALNETDFFGLNNVIELANILAGGILQAAGPGVTVGYLDGTTEITETDVDADGNVTGTTTSTIPNVPLLLTAVKTLTDLDVLSQPSLMTVDNEEAKITVGQEIPIVTTRNTVSNTGFAMGSRVERVDVGVKMTVTPQINEGDFVSLDVEVEVSQPIVSTIGIDPNEVGATFQKSVVQNIIIIKDGSTAVMGGLISTGTDRSISQTPILGDIPGLGWLFRNKSNSRRKRNLVVLITPTIVKDRADIERMTSYKLDEFNDANVDVLFERGFIRKTKQRHYLRNKFRPSATRSQEITSGEERYGRGDMSR